jgi:hypothetical protein
MSRKVLARLNQLNLTSLTDHDLRMELDRELERVYHGHCDNVIGGVGDEQLRAIVYALLQRRRRKRSPQQVEKEERKLEQIYA